MGIQDHSGTPPTSDWFQRFAGTLLSLAPQMRPLDAVRRAMLSFPDSGGQAPEEAAQRHASRVWPDSEAPSEVLPAMARSQSRWRDATAQRPPRD